MPEAAAASGSSEVVILPLRSLNTCHLTRLEKTGAFEVLFLAGDQASFARLRDNLPPIWTMEAPGQGLNAAAAALREIVINLDSHVWPQDADRRIWDESLLGERSPYASSVMISLARLLLFAETTSRPGRYLVIVENDAVGLAFLRFARQRKVSAGWLMPGRSLTLSSRLSAVGEQAGQIVAGFFHRGAFAKRLFLKKLQLRRLRKAYPLPIEGLRRSDALILVWGRTNTFSATATILNEPNFGRLPQLLSAAGARVGYVVNPLTFLAPFNEIALNAIQARDPVALVEDFVPWTAVLTAPLAGLTLRRKLKRLSFYGMNADEMLGLEARRGLCGAASCEASLLRYVGSGLAEIKALPDLVIHQYEGQPWEKAFARGVHDFLQIRVVAVQHAPFSYNHLSWIPSRQQLSLNSSPDLFMMSGSGYAKILENAGVPASKLHVAGGLRYERVSAKPGKSAVALCCTGIQLDEAIELATKSALATLEAGYRLIINFHPITDKTFRETLQREVGIGTQGKVAHIEFSGRSMRALLDDAGVVLYSSSAASFDAIQAGRVAVYVARDLDIDYDKLPEELSLRARSIEDLAGILRSHVPTKSQNPIDIKKWLAPILGVDELRSALALSLVSEVDVQVKQMAGGLK